MDEIAEILLQVYEEMVEGGRGNAGYLADKTAKLENMNRIQAWHASASLDAGNFNRFAELIAERFENLEVETISRVVEIWRFVDFNIDHASPRVRVKFR